MLMSLFLDGNWRARKVADPAQQIKCDLAFIGDRGPVGRRGSRGECTPRSKLTADNSGAAADRGDGLRRPLGHRSGPAARSLPTLRPGHVGPAADIDERQVGERLSLGRNPRSPTC